MNEKGEEVYLTAKEFDLLCFLLYHKGQVFTKKQIYDNVWGYASFYPLIIYYLNRLNDCGLYFRKCKVYGKYFLSKSLRYKCAVRNAVTKRHYRIRENLTRGPGRTIMTCFIKTSARTGEIKSTKLKNHWLSSGTTNRNADRFEAFRKKSSETEKRIKNRNSQSEGIYGLAVLAE